MASYADQVRSVFLIFWYAVACLLARSDTLWLGAGGNVSQILFQCDRPLERTAERSQQLLLALYTPLAAFDPEVRTVAHPPGTYISRRRLIMPLLLLRRSIVLS